VRIAIIGAGFTGLSAAYQLVKKNHEVVIFEKDKNPGGLALGFKIKEWDWSLEQHYHHWFTNDYNALNLAKELYFPYYKKSPKTSIYYHGKSYQLDSAIKLFSLPFLSFTNRLRMAGVLALLRYNPFWKPYEKIEASRFLSRYMGQKAYSLIWEPQLQSKFGKYSHLISLAWFWARISKRTSDFAYPEKGFLAFAEKLTKIIEQQGGKIFYNTNIHKIVKEKNRGYKIITKRNIKEEGVFDAIIVTVPSHTFLNLVNDVPILYREKINKLKFLGAINLILRLKKPFLKDNTYWLSICEKKSPVMAIVEHTNFMDKKYYNNEHIVYLGNYASWDHPFLSMSKQELLEKYDLLLEKIHPEYKKEIIDMYLFKTPFAQPIIPVNYSEIKLPFVTPFKNIFLANMQQIYPWDRGTNYAIELGEKIAAKIH